MRVVAYKALEKLGLNEEASSIAGKVGNYIGQRIKGGIQNAFTPSATNPSGGQSVQDAILEADDDAPLLGTYGGSISGTSVSSSMGADVAADIGLDVGVGALEAIGTVLTASVPIIGVFFALIEGIHEISKGHHEAENRPTFKMPVESVDLPSYNPGIS